VSSIFRKLVREVGGLANPALDVDSKTCLCLCLYLTLSVLVSVRVSVSASLCVCQPVSQSVSLGRSVRQWVQEVGSRGGFRRWVQEVEGSAPGRGGFLS